MIKRRHITVREIVDKFTWDAFFNENGSPSFLHSWEWGEFEKLAGYNLTRLGIYENKSLQAIALVLKIKAKRGSFLFIPHGPVFPSTLNTKRSTIKLIIKEILDYLIELAKKGSYSFIRIAPILENTPENLKIFSALGFKKAPIYMHAERLWILPLIKNTQSKLTKLERPLQVGQYFSDEEMLLNMRKTTRYLIRKAQRDGVSIEKRTDEKAVDDFYKIYEETAKRENFVPFSKTFIREEFNAFYKTGNAIFLFGTVPTLNPTPEDGSRFLAASLIIFTKSTAFYHQGASIHTKIPVTYLLQWEAIKEAKRRGCQFYNFWGILQEGRSPKNWQGLTLFKTGFGGRQVDYTPTQDFIISPKYYLTYFYEKFLAARRGV